MALNLDEIVDFDAPLETEDGGLNFNHPLVLLFRKLMIEQIAKSEESDLYCPRCTTNLPYNDMTVARVPDGFDANFDLCFRTTYFCTICQDYFDKKTEIVKID